MGSPCPVEVEMWSVVGIPCQPQHTHPKRIIFICQLPTPIHQVLLSAILSKDYFLCANPHTESISFHKPQQAHTVIIILYANPHIVSISLHQHQSAAHPARIFLILGWKWKASAWEEKDEHDDQELLKVEKDFFENVPGKCKIVEQRKSR